MLKRILLTALIMVLWTNGANSAPPCSYSTIHGTTHSVCYVNGVLVPTYTEMTFKDGDPFQGNWSASGCPPSYFDSDVAEIRTYKYQNGGYVLVDLHEIYLGQDCISNSGVLHTSSGYNCISPACSFEILSHYCPCILL